jgi:hypothetical protein
MSVHRPMTQTDLTFRPNAEITMPHFLTAIARVLAPGATEDAVHFHQGPTGAPACCYDARCTSPRLQPEA